MIFRSVYKYKQPSDPGEGVYCSFLLCRLDLLACMAVLQAPRSDSGAICHLIDLVPGFELRGADLNLTHNRK